MRGYFASNALKNKQPQLHEPGLLIDIVLYFGEPGKCCILLGTK